MVESKFLECSKMTFKVFWDLEAKVIDRAWMEKVAESKQCSMARYLNGHVVEVVFR
jgi:hypothetical protein